MPLAITYEAVAAGSEAVEQMLWFGGGLLVLGLAAMILSGRSHRARKRRKDSDEDTPR